MELEEATREIYESMRENNTLRHRLGIEEGPMIVDGEPGLIAWTDKEGEDWFLKVEPA